MSPLYATDATGKQRPRLHDTNYSELMKRRICNVLLVANPYDAFMLEDDGRVDEKIFSEYARLGLRFPPRFIQVSSQEEAEQTIGEQQIDLVIVMPSRSQSAREEDVFEIAKGIKTDHTELPIVVLTPFSHGITARMRDIDLSMFEYVFCWLGNTDLLLTIIKLIEDKMNLDDDVAQGVRMILLVEDNIRFYSSILASLYKFVLQQSLAFASEALNTNLETLRMRGRPKIVLARNYQEAWELYQAYKENTLGIITDCRYPMTPIKGANPTEEEKEEDAGFRLLGAIRAEDPYMPLIMESAESANRERAVSLGYHFIDKNSKKIDMDLRDMVHRCFGFGDLIFDIPDPAQPDAPELTTQLHIRNLKDLQNNILTVPSESLLYHVERNNVSRWLGSRALFPISDFLKHVTWDSLQDVEAHRQIIFEAIVAYRLMKNQGVVAVFQSDRFDQYSNFARIGDGSLGGKGRGLAFIDHILQKRSAMADEHATPGAGHPGPGAGSAGPADAPRDADGDAATAPGDETGPDGRDLDSYLHIPKTVVLCTDVFDQFMDENGLYTIALSDASDDEILQAFLRGHLPDRLIADLEAFMEVVRRPIAARSSSLLEDSHYQPFAGIYSTYMIPYVRDKYQRMSMLADAVKAVYASVYYKSSKDYMTATSNVIDQEKMAVILQEVIGQQHGSRFYPVISGVARSVNYYPIGDEEADEGTVSLAFGLGKHIVDGGTALRVCPAHPAQVLQMSEMEIALRDTQTSFLALTVPDPEAGTGAAAQPGRAAGSDASTAAGGKPSAGSTAGPGVGMAASTGGPTAPGIGLAGGSGRLGFKTDDGFNLRRFPIRDAEQDGTLPFVCSTFDPMEQCIYDGYYEGRNRKIVSMVGVLQNGLFPLPQLLRKVLRYGQEEMRRPVEIEFAVDLRRRADGKCDGEFYLLQIRPMVDNRMALEEDLLRTPDEQCLMRSHNAIGFGVWQDIHDIIYVKTEGYSASQNPAIADEMEHVNRHMLDTGRSYLLVGPGRWGSSDPWLGIPVKWPAISGAKVIVEAGLESFQVDPSQGTHFFQNLTSLGVAYLTIDAFRGDGVYRQDVLDALPAEVETDHLRLVHLDRPLTIKVDGIHREAIVVQDAE